MYTLSDPLYHAFIALTGLSIAVRLVQFCGHSSLQKLRDLPVLKKRFPRIAQIKHLMVVIIVFTSSISNKMWLSNHGDHGPHGDYGKIGQMPRWDPLYIYSPSMSIIYLWKKAPPNMATI